MRHPSVFVFAAVVPIVMVVGCEEHIDLDPLDDSAPIEARVRPKPISGGTLTIVGDGIAVASDPDRDVVHVVDVADREVRHTIALEPGDEPGRVVAGDDGVAHVVLRGFGGVATLDLAAGTVRARHRTCPDPRGVAFAASTVRVESTLHVACADGSLVELAADSGEVLARTELEPDLRDVVVFDGEIHVSLFRKAGLMRADRTRTTLPDSGDHVPRVAWRTWADPALGERGGVLMLHQLATTVEVPIDVDAADLDVGGSPYGGSGGSFCQPGITIPALTILEPDGGSRTMTIVDARLTVDAAISPDTDWLALAMPGAEEDRASVQLIHPPDGTACLGDQDTMPQLVGMGQVTAVAFLSDGTLVMQSREPARLLVLEGLPDGTVDAIELEGESRFDTGHEIFHRATESTLSCASCHPDGTDDGHTWKFEQLGKRRTQSLDIGLAGTAPFHWNGDMDDLDTLMGEVLAHRMGGNRQSKARRESFERWLFAQERPPAATGREDPTQVGDGEALFASYGCGKCHGGEDLGGSNTERFGGVELQVPSLRRVALRAPFMHDGRSSTLDLAVRDMIEGSAGSVEPPQADVDALVAFLRTR